MRTRLLALVFIVGLTGACGGGSAPVATESSQPGNQPSSTTKGSSTPTLAKALDFDSPSVIGDEPVVGRDLAGEPVALWFWAPW